MAASLPITPPGSHTRLPSLSLFLPVIPVDFFDTSKIIYVGVSSDVWHKSLRSPHTLPGGSYASCLPTAFKSWSVSPQYLISQN